MLEEAEAAAEAAVTIAIATRRSQKAQDLEATICGAGWASTAAAAGAGSTAAETETCTPGTSCTTCTSDTTAGSSKPRPCPAGVPPATETETGRIVSLARAKGALRSARFSSGQWWVGTRRCATSATRAYGRCRTTLLMTAAAVSGPTAGEEGVKVTTGTTRTAAIRWNKCR